jgi:hypothetical protein
VFHKAFAHGTCLEKKNHIVKHLKEELWARRTPTIDLAIGASIITDCPTKVKICEYIEEAMSNWLDLQAGPSTTVTAWHMCKITNQKTMQKLILALEPDALSSRFESSRRRRDN